MSDRETVPDSDFLDDWDDLDLPDDSASGQIRSVNVDTRPQRPEASSLARRRAPAGRHQAPRHAAPARAAAKRRPAPSEPIPAPAKDQPSGKKHRPIAKKRRRRRIILCLSLVFAAAAAFILKNILTPRVKDFQISSPSAEQQVLTWKSVHGAERYDVFDGDGKLLAKVKADEAPQYVADGLKSGTQYTYSVSAVNVFFGEHPGKAVTCSAYTLPEAVSAMTAMNSGTGVLLSWENSGARSYEVEYTDPSGEEKTLDVSPGDAEGFSIPDLQEGAQYMFNIRSFVQDGDARVYSSWTSSEPITAARAADMTGVRVDEPMVALTFDDGPDYDDCTERILAVLEEYDGHATFFQIGIRAADLSEKLTNIVKAGHELGCHTYDHSHYGDAVTPNDIVSADDAIEEACGQRPTVFRSPGGMTTDLIRGVCTDEHMPIFYWSIDTEDWKSRNADSVCKAVMNYVKDGDIILMHNVYESTADAVERIVPFLAEKGYQMVTVSQLVQAKTGKPPVPGTQYITATRTN